MTIDTIRARAGMFDQRARRQDLASIAAFALIVVSNAVAIAFETSAVERLGDGLSIAAAAYVLHYYWRVRGVPPAALGETPSIDLYRNQILRRQAMMGRIWTVVLLFLPGIVLSTIGNSRMYVPAALTFAFLLLAIELLNRREARRLSLELEAAIESR